MSTSRPSCDEVSEAIDEVLKMKILIHFILRVKFEFRICGLLPKGWGGRFTATTLKLGRWMALFFVGRISVDSSIGPGKQERWYLL